MRRFVLQAFILAGAACIASAHAAEPLRGTYALPDGAPKVTSTLTATAAGGAKQVLDIAMTPIGAAAPEPVYETELSKQLHVIAVSQDLRTFVHEHGEAPRKDGHFRIPIALAGKGLWHIYADGVPKGLGQQVMRFELVLGSGGPTAPPPLPAPTGTQSVEGRYAVKFDGIDLKAGQEAELGLHLLRDGKPAADVTPFLGVAAHAVFIAATDLTYVHVHAAPAEAPAMGGTGAGMQHEMAGMPGMEGMGAPLPAGSKVPPDLTLHIKAPKAGTYMLWIQFEGGGKVRTVPFVVAAS